MLRKALLSGAASVALSATAAQAIEIELNFNIGPDVDPVLAAQAQAGFETAASIWESRFRDPITVRIDAGFDNLGGNILGQTGSTSAVAAFSTIRDAMTADARSAADFQAVANLPTADSFSFITNSLGTPDGVEISVLDTPGRTLSTTDNSFLSVNTANLKALGFDIGDDVVDANVTFNSQFAFDFDPSDGIAADAIDFVGVAAHELGHALGFVSGVDTVDILSGAGPLADTFVRDPLAAMGLPPEAFAGFNALDALALAQGSINDDGTISPAGFAIFSPLDLFRFSDLSFDDQGNFLGFDFTTGLGIDEPLTFADFDQRLANRTDIPFFSIDGGQTALAPFATGSFNGGIDFMFDNGSLLFLNGNQASHFFADFGVITPFGIMDPNFANGELGRIRSPDITAFDVIGFDIPTPASIGFLGLGLIGLGVAARRRRTGR